MMDKLSIVPSRAGRREWIGLAVLALPTLLLSLDMSVLYLAMPQLAEDLAPSSTQFLWIMDIYGFLIAGFLVTMGTLGDRIGRRKLLMIGAAAFGIASMLAAYSSSAEMLIVNRALLGIAGATLMPSTLALISNMFKDPGQRGMAISVWMSCFMVGVAIGPLIGGLLLEQFWWGSVFLLGVPIMLLLLIAAPLLLPEYRDSKAEKMDLASVGLFLAAILPIVYGLKELAKAGALEWQPVALLLFGGLVAVWFVRRQQTLTSPLLDIALLRNRTFSATLGMIFFTTASMGGIILFVNQHLQLVKGLSPLNAGLWLLPPAVAVIIGTILAPILSKRFGPGYIVSFGMAIAGIGLLMLALYNSSSSLHLVVAGYFFTCLGVGPVGALGTDIVVGSAPPEKAGSASAMSETCGELGAALGVAVMGSIGTAVYRGQMDGSLPVVLSPEEAKTAGDTLVGAITVSQNLPDSIAFELLDQARNAFIAGFNMVSAISLIASILVAILVFRMLHNLKPSKETRH
jgi:DHA2 family multidrug resistance protein-like MFS transporter